MQAANRSALTFISSTVVQVCEKTLYFSRLGWNELDLIQTHLALLADLKNRTSLSLNSLLLCIIKDCTTRNSVFFKQLNIEEIPTVKTGGKQFKLQRNSYTTTSFVYVIGFKIFVCVQAQACHSMSVQVRNSLEHVFTICFETGSLPSNPTQKCWNYVSTLPPHPALAGFSGFQACMAMCFTQ